jgi:glycerate-2-kinase
VRTLVRNGRIPDKIPELPREWRGQGRAPINLLLLENTEAVLAAGRAATTRGYRVEVDPVPTEGDYKAVADAMVERLSEHRRGESSEKLCFVFGGEFSCSVTGRGFGGRNQEFVLYCAAQLAARGLSGRIAVLSCGTDGIDGNSSAAGAVGDAGLISAGGEVGLDASSFIAGNSSTSFLCETGSLIFTGPTGNNVRDLTILLVN